MRWRKGDTCLSEASCVTFSPPLAFACKLRGTAPKIISARGRRLTGASPKPITYTATAGDISHHEGIDAAAQGMMIIDAGHYGLEHIFMDFMEGFLKEKLPADIEVVKMAVKFPAVVV